ncbi:MAG: hypothetical protein HN368_17500 [Spirochaetales bacterium]|jgi:hypothetical protein|nr:hypothetical protein [Spirochaetales bacterium]
MIEKMVAYYGNARYVRSLRPSGFGKLERLSGAMKAGRKHLRATTDVP